MCNVDNIHSGCDMAVFKVDIERDAAINVGLLESKNHFCSGSTDEISKFGENVSYFLFYY